MGAGAMTLAELQVILTANIAQVLPQVMEVRRAFGTLNESADQTGRSIDKTVSDTSAKAEKALDSQNKAEDKSAQETKKASQTKRQSLEEIAAIAQRAAERYNQSLAGMTGKPMEFSDNEPASSGKTATAILAARRQAEEAAQNITSAVDPSRMEQVQHTADQVRQSVDAMFADERAGSSAAQQAYDTMAAKLGNITTRADVLRMRISQMRAEYAKVAEQSGADSPGALKLQNQILLAENRLAALAAQSDKTAAALEELKTSETQAGNAAQQMGRKTEEADTHIRAASSSTGGLQREFSRMGRQIISQILVWQLFFGAMGALGTYTWNALKTNTAFSNSLNNLKVQLLTAFYPIYQAALPALTSLINALAKAMAYIAAFISGFFGKTYSESEKGAAGLNKNVKALQDTSKAAQDAKKALAGFDEINTLNKTASTGSTAATGADAALANTDFGAASAKPLISESQIAAAEAAGARVRAIFQSISDFATRHATIIKGAVAGIVGAFLLFKTITFVQGIVSGISNAFSFLVSNPAVAVILAITAVVGVIIYLYNTNKTVHSGLLAAWAALKQAGQSAFGAITSAMRYVWDRGGSYTLTELGKLGTSILKLAAYILANFVLPFVSWFTTMISPAVSVVIAWIGNLFELVQDLINWLLGSGKRVLDIILGAISGILVVLGLYEVKCLAVKIAQLAVAAATNIAQAAIWLFNAALNANPISLTILLLGALVGAFIALWNNCAGFRNFWIGLWDDITGAVRSAVNGILYAWNAAARTLNQIHVNIPSWSPIGGGETLGFSLPVAAYLAEGGIVSSATAFVAGEAGSEAVLPLQRNTGWMDTLAAKVASQVPQGASNLTVTMPVYLDGREIYQNTKKYALRDARGSNAPAFT